MDGFLLFFFFFFSKLFHVFTFYFIPHHISVSFNEDDDIQAWTMLAFRRCLHNEAGTHVPSLSPRCHLATFVSLHCPVAMSRSRARASTAPCLFAASIRLVCLHDLCTQSARDDPADRGYLPLLPPAPAGRCHAFTRTSCSRGSCGPCRRCPLQEIWLARDGQNDEKDEDDGGPRRTAKGAGQDDRVGDQHVARTGALWMVSMVDRASGQPDRQGAEVEADDSQCSRCGRGSCMRPGTGAATAAPCLGR